MKKKTILILTSCYLPGFKGGGPIQSISNLVDYLGKEFNFRIVTTDRDMGETIPYSEVIPEEWNTVGQAQVLYLKSKKQNFLKIFRLLNNAQYDILYINSFFSLKYSIFPLVMRFLNLIPTKPTVLAPRGEFSQGALRLKSIKKKLFISLVKLLKIYNGILWQATSEIECRDIQRIIKDATIYMAPNLVSLNNFRNNTKISKKKGEVNLAFLSRISPKKNLHGAIKILKNIEVGEITFSILGPIENEGYFNECMKLLNRLPPNIKWKYYGPINKNKVCEILNKHHFFYFPTYGENFGHVIIEALNSGCPLIISDNTPWRNLEKNKIGWDISINNESLWVDILKKCIAMNDEEYQIMRSKCFQYAQKIACDFETVYQNKLLFELALKVRK